jgi:hypothetical protein
MAAKGIRFVPTPDQRKQVDAMAGYGVPEDAIAKVIGIDPHTLRKHFRHELDTAHVRANSAVAQSLYQKAVGNGPQAVTACIFWLKTRARWKEPATEFETTLIGKKEQAIAAARTAGIGSEWSDDLEFNEPVVRPN